MVDWQRLGAAAWAAMAVCSAQAAVSADPTDPYETRVLELINVERAAQGLKALLLDLHLDAAAEAHSLDLATQNCWSHDSCDGTAWSTRIKGYYTAPTTIGEIIAAGYSTPEAVVQGWMNSAGHKANILNSSFVVAGVGLVNASASASYPTYWTVDFGGQRTDQTVVTMVPEVPSLPLMALGLLGVAAVTHRHRQG